MDTGLDCLPAVALQPPRAEKLESDVGALLMTPTLDASWELPPLRSYAPGRNVIRPASLRLLARHRRLAAMLAAGLLGWSMLSAILPGLPQFVRLAPACALASITPGLARLAIRLAAGSTRPQ